MNSAPPTRAKPRWTLRNRPAVAALALPLALAAVLAGAGPGAARGAAQEVFDHTHALWGAVLGDHARGGRFDYRALARERSRFDSYLLELARVTPAQIESWSEAERCAYFANARNAFVVARVVDAYPIASILDLSTEAESVWAQRTIPLGQHLAPDRDLVSLDELERAILRPRFRDARLAFALTSAALGGPALDPAPLTGERLSEELDRRVRDFLLDPRKNCFDRAAGRIELARLFERCREDVERDAGSLRAFLRHHLPGDDDLWVETAEIAYRADDWKLDAVPDEEAPDAEAPREAGPGERAAGSR